MSDDQTLEMENLLSMQLADRYVVQRALAWGSDAIEYLEAERDGAPLVLAVLPEIFAAGAAKEAFVTLAESLKDLDATTVLSVVGWDVVDGIPVLEYEREDGKPISTALAKGPLPSVPLLKVADQVLRGLVRCHRASLVHGDVTPENVLVLRDGDMKSPIIRLIGAGLGPLLREHGVIEENNPMAGAFALDYLPPEVARGQRASARSDLFSTGVLMHHMVLGKPPEGYDSRDGFADIPQMPDVIRRATARDPAERYSDAAGMLAALDWLDVVSSKMNPHTQDIPLWMEYSVVGNIPVTQLNASSDSRPPGARRSSRPPPPSSRPPASLASGRPSSRPPAPLGSLAGLTMPGSRASTRPPSAPPPGILKGSHFPHAAHSAAPVRIVVSPSMSAPHAGSNAPAVPTIPGPAGVPQVKRRGDEQTLWWVAAALCLVIILLGLGYLWLQQDQPETAGPPAPTSAPAMGQR